MAISLTNTSNYLFKALENKKEMTFLTVGFNEEFGQYKQCDREKNIIITWRDGEIPGGGINQ